MIQEKISFKIFLIYSSGVHFVRRNGTISAILVGLRRNNFVMLCKIWGCGLGDVVLKTS